MSSLQNNKDELANTLKKLIKMTSMIVFLAMIGLACLSEPIILVLLGGFLQPIFYFGFLYPIFLHHLVF